MNFGNRKKNAACSRGRIGKELGYKTGTTSKASNKKKSKSTLQCSMETKGSKGIQSNRVQIQNSEQKILMCKPH